MNSTPEPRRRARVVLTVILAALFLGGVTLMHPTSNGTAAMAPSVSPGPYAITFRDTGPAAGLVWSVEVLASNGTPVGEFSTSNQSYVLTLARGTYSYVTTPPIGWVFGEKFSPGFAVRSARAISVPFKVAPGFSSWSFHERGLLPGQRWHVTLNWTGNSTGGTPPDPNLTESSTGPTIRFAVWLGALYFIQIASLASYNGPSISTGYLRAQTHAFNEVVRYWGPKYNITFAEVGLTNLSSQTWSVTFWGPTYSSNGTATIVVPGITRGTGYWYRIIPPAGFQASPAEASKLRVSGPSTIVITFTPV